MNAKLEQAEYYLSQYITCKNKAQSLQWLEVMDVRDSSFKPSPDTRTIYVKNTDLTRVRASFDFNQLQGIDVLIVDDDCMLSDQELNTLPSSLVYADLSFKPISKYGMFIKEFTLHHLTNLEFIRLPRMYLFDFSVYLNTCKKLRGLYLDLHVHDFKRIEEPYCLPKLKIIFLKANVLMNSNILEHHEFPYDYKLLSAS